jgi:hypothetical protein
MWTGEKDENGRAKGSKGNAFRKFRSDLSRRDIMRIAQLFSVRSKLGRGDPSRRDGRNPPLRSFSRPFGTERITAGNPRLKPWAIVLSPFGTICGRDDIPGIGYFIVPAMMGGISALIFWFRKRLATGGTQ